jgi:hypothetical protein
MPIAIACKACGTKYNVPDHMAGRSAKCKCGGPIAVPAGAARAMQPAAPRPAPARQAAPVRQPAVEQEIEIGEGDVVEADAPTSSLGSFSLDSLNDLGVPPKMQAKVREEIKPNEKILWMGRPMMSYARKIMWIGAIAGWIFLAIGIGVLYFMHTVVMAKDDIPPIFGLIYYGIPGLFVLFGLVLATMPFWYGYLTPYRDVYILTNKRAIVADCESWVKCNVRSYTAANMKEFGASEYGSIKGAGDLKFCTEMVDMGYRSSHGTNSLGQRTITHKQDFQPRDRGFLMIENVRQVAALVRQTLFNQSGPQR